MSFSISVLTRAAVTLIAAFIGLQSTANAATCNKYDYVVVGAGAGGGPVASRLAIAGYKVLLIDAGSTYSSPNITIPIFHPLSNEDPNISWEYFVQHYPAGSPNGRQNVFYPRSSGLGGCTAHHAMLGLYPFAKDWDNLAALTGDASWQNSNMRGYFERMENNLYAPEIIGKHGRNGWLPTSQIDLRLALDPIDIKLLSIFASVGISAPLTLFNDINYPGANEREGWHLPPVMIANGTRSGVYRFIMDTKARFPGNLDIMTDTLVTKILVDDKNVAYGVQVAKGRALYNASPLSNKGTELPPLEEILVNREVIVSAGSYSTPQLLMLSGIGDRDKLSKLNISTKVHLPGVGRNLQDRYEVSVNYELTEPWGLTKDCQWKASESDPCYKKYLQKPASTVYGSNGVAIATTRKSFGDEVDSYIFVAPAPFSGYKVGYSKDLAKIKNQLSILILKARTNNTNGEVNLRSTNPREVPQINFNYFSDGDSDLNAVVKQIRTARDLGDFITLNPFIRRELIPGSSVDTDDEIKDHIRKNAWGHHACCTAKIGKDSDPNAVLDNNFKVRGVKNLRVVDASVFPKIPGFFIVVPIYMASEKAADVIVAEAKANPTVCTP